MSGVLGKRISYEPERYGIYQMESVVSKGRSRKKGVNNGDGGRFQSQNKPSGAEGNDSDSDDNSQYNPSESETMENVINEFEEIVENNSGMIKYVKENVFVVLKVLWEVLPLDVIQRFAEKTKDIKSDDHQWAQDLTYQHFGPRGNTEAEQGKNVIVNNVKDTGTASVTAAQTNTNINYAAATAATLVPNATNQTDLNNLIKQNLEEISRKKNIVIAGMDEDYDDDLLVRNMLGVMGCGFLYHDINKRPTRLGMKRGNRARALKVEMNSEEAVEEIMKCKKNLRNPNENFYSIYVNRDLRKEEREKEIEQRMARKRRIFRDSAAGAGENLEITAGSGVAPAQQATSSSGQGGSPAHQTTPNNGQSAETETPIIEAGTDLTPITDEIRGEIEVENGEIIPILEDSTEITSGQVSVGSDAIVGIGDSSDRDGGNPQEPNLGSSTSIPRDDQESTDNGSGNGGGKTVTPQP